MDEITKAELEVIKLKIKLLAASILEDQKFKQISPQTIKILESITHD